MLVSAVCAPEAMERTLEIIEQELEIVGAGAPPCDAAGNAP